jgi:hypothetical protein
VGQCLKSGLNFFLREKSDQGQVDSWIDANLLVPTAFARTIGLSLSSESLDCLLILLRSQSGPLMRWSIRVRHISKKRFLSRLESKKYKSSVLARAPRESL